MKPDEPTLPPNTPPAETHKEREGEESNPEALKKDQEENYTSRSAPGSSTYKPSPEPEPYAKSRNQELPDESGSGDPQKIKESESATGQQQRAERQGDTSTPDAAQPHEHV